MCDHEMIKICLYADDTFLMLDGSESSLRETVLLLNTFHVYSGLKINLDKSQAIWLGSLKRSSICNDLNLNWVKQIKLLGGAFSVNLDNIIELNFGTKILEMEKLFNLSKQFNLSIVGKVTVIKTLVLPKIVYFF